jgi:phosphohistidine phosphatase
MYLYLMQHGEAKPEKEDPARPLSVRGRADVVKAASFVAAAVKLKINTLHHSPKTRASETARILGGFIVPSPDIQEADGLLPLDDPSVWAEGLRDSTTDCMLVGHLPHLAKLASLLVSGSADANIVDFKMGGIVCLRRSDAGCFAVSWMVVPDMLP